MGCDMHWLLERKHQDGHWMPILASDMAMRQLYDKNDALAFAHPTYQAKSRDYEFFTLLADVRNDGPSPEQTLLSSDLPIDMSEVANEWLHRGDYHTPGWASLGRIREWSLHLVGLSCLTYLEHEAGGEDTLFFMLKHRKAAFEAILTESLDLAHPLHLPIYNDDYECTYGLETISAHDRIQDLNFLKELQPIADDTVRFFFVFDN
jgi:hypothetical protein